MPHSGDASIPPYCSHSASTQSGSGSISPHPQQQVPCWTRGLSTSLPAKVVKRILDLDFVEMAELTIEEDPPPSANRLPTPARPPTRSISQWIERYSLIAALISSRFPDKAPELFAYQSFEGARWTSYDRSYRRWPERTSTGRWHSLGEHGPSPDASRTTTRKQPALTAQFSQTLQPGSIRHCSTGTHTPYHLPAIRRYAGAIMKASTRKQSASVVMLA